MNMRRPTWKKVTSMFLTGTMLFSVPGNTISIANADDIYQFGEDYGSDIAAPIDGSTEESDADAAAFAGGSLEYADGYDAAPVDGSAEETYTDAAAITDGSNGTDYMEADENAGSGDVPGGDDFYADGTPDGSFRESDVSYADADEIGGAGHDILSDTQDAADEEGAYGDGDNIPAVMDDGTDRAEGDASEPGFSGTEGDDITQDPLTDRVLTVIPEPAIVFDSGVSDEFLRADSLWRGMYGHGVLDTQAYGDGGSVGLQGDGDADVQDAAAMDQPAAIEISGFLPESVTAEASYYLFPDFVRENCSTYEYSEDGSNTYCESGLIALDIDLVDGNGEPYVPAEPVTVRVSGGIVQEGQADGGHFFIYSYEENPERAAELGRYAADVTVYRDLMLDEGSLPYELPYLTVHPGADTSAVLFAEDGQGLYQDETGAVCFNAEYFPLQFVLTAVMPSAVQPEEEDASFAGGGTDERNGADDYTDENPDSDPEDVIGNDEGWELPDTESRAEEMYPDVDADSYAETAPVSDSGTDGAKPDAPGDAADGTFSGSELPGTSGEAQQMAYAADNYTVVVSCTEEANIPAGAELDVTERTKNNRSNKLLQEQAIEAAGASPEDVVSVTLVDLSIRKDGEEVDPDAMVDVLLQVNQTGDNADTETSVISLLNADTPVVLEGETTDEGQEFATSVDSMKSVYAIVEKTLRKVLTASDGNTYEISVTYGSEAEVPAGAELAVTEIPAGDSAYDEYLAQSAEKLGVSNQAVSYAKFFDISILSEGEKVEIASPVSVQIRLMDKPAESGADDGQDENAGDAPDQNQILHFSEEGAPPEIVESSTESGGEAGDAVETVTFEAEGFSVYGVVQIIKERILEAGDGNRYKVTVEYDSTSGIPGDAELVAAELGESDPEYGKYIERTAEVLGQEVEYLAFARAFDISLLNPETGEHYQPDKKVKVRLELLDRDLSEGDSLSVVHFNGGAEGKEDRSGEKGETYTDETPGEPEILENSVNQEGVIEFETDGFSVYVVAETDLMRHYVFMNNGNVFAEQVLIDGESVRRPPDPSRAGAVFDHWATEENGETPVTFDEPEYNNITIDADSIPGSTNREKQDYLNQDAQKVKFYAVYKQEKVVVAFYNQSGLVVNKVEVLKPVDGQPANTLDTTAAEYDYVPIQDKEGAVIEFQYWTDSPSGVGADAGVLQITSAETRSIIELYPVLQEGHYLYFNSNRESIGGASTSYVAPAFLVNRSGDRADNIEATATALETLLAARDDHGIPTAGGYTFKGWYLIASDSNDGDGTGQNKALIKNESGTLTVNDTEFAKLFDAFGNLPNNPTLYAHWEAVTTANYTVVFWKQKITDSKNTADADKEYDYVDSVVRTGRPGDPAPITNADISRNYPGFYYNANTSTSNAVIAPNGSTTVHVRYDRYKVTYEFYRYSSRQWKIQSASTMTGLYNQQWKEAQANNENYGWPSGLWASNYSGGYPAGTPYTYLDGFTNIDQEQSSTNNTTHIITTKFYFYTNSGTAQVIHEFQDTNGNYTTAGEKVTYSSSNSFSNAGFNLSDKFAPGFKVRGYSWDAFTTNFTPGADGTGTGTHNSTKLYVYHERVKNDLIYADSKDPNGTPYKTESVYYDAPLNGYSSYTPAKDGYMFTGWFYDTTCTERVDFGTKRMEAANLVVYAGWTQLKFRAILIPNGGDMAGQGTSFNLDPNEKISLGEDPTRDFVKVADGEGDYTYDPVKGVYTEAAEEGEGNYIEKKGAYTFLGWYEAQMDPASVMQLENQDLEQYTNSSGETRWRYIQKDKNTGAVGAPVQDASGDYSTARRFDMNTAPNKAVTVVAMWQRAGGFYVRYNIEDDKLPNTVSYATIQTPVDNEEYIDGAHALVLASLGAPKGYALDYWEGPKTTSHPDGHYQPNELVEIRESLATQEGAALYIDLTARYRTYDPTERQMADYTFLVDANGNFDFSDDEVYEVQRIAINEELKAPQTPPSPGDNYAFKGWYYDKEGTRRFDSFGVISNPVYTTLYGLFDKVFTVNYYLTKVGVIDPTADGVEKTILASQTYKDPGAGSADSAYEVLDARHVLNPVDADHYVTMWVSDWNRQEITTENEPYQYPYNSVSNRRVKGDLDLYAVVKERKYVEFDSQGGSFVPMQEIRDGNWPARPDAPTREGYAFLGWFTDKTDPNTAYEFDRVLTDTETVLYAHWKSNGSVPAKLTLLWWAQTSDRPEDPDEANADTEHYQLIATRTIDSYVGEYTLPEEIDELGLPANWNNIVNVMQWAVNDGQASAEAFVDNNGGDVSKLDNYYEYSTQPKAIDANLVIDDSGDATLNIRFDLRVVKIIFNPTTNFKIGIAANTYKTNTDKYEITYAWFNKKIAAQWPVENPSRQTAAGANGPWVEKTSSAAANRTFTGWTYNDGSTHNYLSIKPYVDSIMMNSAINNGGFIELTALDTTFTRYPGYTHFLERVNGQWVEIDESWCEQVKVGTANLVGNDPNVREDPNNPNQGISKQFAAKNISGYEILDKSNRIDDSHYAHGTNDSGYPCAQYEKRPANQEYDVTQYRNVYHYEKTEDWNSITFYAGYTPAQDAYREWGIIGYTGLFGTLPVFGWIYHDYVPASYSNPVDVTFNYDAALAGKTATDGTALDQYTFTENNYRVYSSNGAAIGNVYYKDANGTHHQISLAQFKQQFIDSTQKQYEYTEHIITTGDEYDLYFYYKPQSYGLNLYTGGVASGTPFASESVAYRTMLSGSNGLLKNFVPTGDAIPQNRREGYTFVGWSELPNQSDLSAAYSANNGRMPANNLILYAIWAPITYTVTTRGVDATGNGNEGAASMTYEGVAHGTQLKVLRIQDARKDAALFTGWRLVAVDGTELAEDQQRTITGNYTIKNNIVIEPTWDSFETRSVEYKANFPEGLTGSGEAPVDENKYLVGAKVNIKDGSGLSIMRKNIDGDEYEATFAYWNTKADGTGDNYYPNTTFVFREGAKDDQGQPQTKLTLYAIYSEYRETRLIYDKNAAEAVFLNDDNSGAEYTGNKNADGQVEVLFRDKMNPKYTDETRYPNAEFPVGQDAEGNKFTVTRTDTYGNSFYFAGWGTSATDSYAYAQNGDTAYVNTIDAENTNTLYAVWGICKIQTDEVDRWGVSYHRERVFPTIQAAVEYVASDPTDAAGNKIFTNKTATIEMLIDYKKPNSDAPSIPSGCNITLTTATTGVLRYQGSGTVATITRAQTGESLFVNNGSFTTTNILFDGASGSLTGRAITNNASLTVAGGSTFRNFSVTGSGNEGGAIHSTADAAIQTKAGETVTFIDCTSASEGGAISLDGKKLTIQNAGTLSFENCSGTVGGAICTDTAGEMAVTNRGTLEFNNCTCSSGQYGGGAIWTGIFKAGDNSGSISFSNCTAANFGGAIVASRDSSASDTFVLTNTAAGTASFTGCTAKDGGAVYVANGKCTVTAANAGNPITFAGCAANGTGSTGKGGAIYQGGGDAMTLTNVHFENCAASNFGGAICQSGTGALSLTNVTFGVANTPASGCTAALEGACVYSTGSNAELTDCNFYYGTAGDAAQGLKSRGGAVYFEGSASQSTSLSIYGCVFDHCSALTTSGTQAFGNGGAIYVNDKADLVIGSSSGRRSSFTDCVAHRFGGAVMYEPNGVASVSISGTDFTGCYTEIRGGGAISTDSNQTTIDDCTFTRCYDMSSSGGGAIQLHPDDQPGSNPSCTISNSTFQDCYTTGGNGGAIFAVCKNVPVTLENVSIDGHTTGNTTSLDAGTANASNGGAVYSKGDLTIRQTGTGKSEIKNCSASDANGGAVNINTGKKITFEGNVVVYGNPNSNDGTQQKNVVLDQNNNATINTTATGLGADAHVGIYVIGNATTNPYKDHGTYGKPFGTRAGTTDKNLDKFTNDRHPELFGVDSVDAGVTAAANTTIYWGRYICKIVDSDNKEHVFPTLSKAVTHSRENTNDYDDVSKVCTIQMLVDYEVPANDSVTLNQADNIVLTTAPIAASFTGETYLFDPTLNTISARKTDGADVDSEETAILARKSDFNNSLFTVGNASAALTMTNIILDGASVRTTANGGIVNVTAGSLTVTSGATLRNSTAANGGAVYLASGAVMTMNTGMISGNAATNAGAGIYVAQGATLNLSGNPNFGGTDTNADGSILGTSGNFLKVSLTSAKNGDKDYLYPRQDIYIAGYFGAGGNPVPATSLNVTGAITSGDGTIWVWAEVPNTGNESNHYHQLMQFAVFTSDLAEADRESTVKAFRNAVDDETTENGTGTYLYGTVEGDMTVPAGFAGNIYWNGIEGSRKVILRKVDDGTYASVSGKTFAIYKGSSTTAYTPKGGTQLSGLTSGAAGCFWIGILPYGTYIIEETDPHRFFYIIVDESGTYGTLEEDGTGKWKDKAGGYEQRSDAETAAKKKSDALKEAKAASAANNS